MGFALYRYVGPTCIVCHLSHAHVGAQIDWSRVFERAVESGAILIEAAQERPVESINVVTYYYSNRFRLLRA